MTQYVTRHDVEKTYGSSLIVLFDETRHSGASLDSKQNKKFYPVQYKVHFNLIKKGTFNKEKYKSWNLEIYLNQVFKRIRSTNKERIL